MKPKKINCPQKKPKTNKYLFDRPRVTRNDFLSEIVEQFIKRRQQLQLSQEDVDLRIGNSDRLCSKWECGLRTPTSFNLLCWAEALNSKIILQSLDD